MSRDEQIARRNLILLSQTLVDTVDEVVAALVRNPIPNKRRLTTLRDRCGLLQDALADAFSHGVDEADEPLHDLADVMRHFQSLAYDLQNRSVTWFIRNTSRIRERIDHLSLRIQGIYDRFLQSALNTFREQNQHLRDENERLWGVLENWASRDSVIAEEDRQDLIELVSRHITAQDLQEMGSLDGNPDLEVALQYLHARRRSQRWRG